MSKKQTTVSTRALEILKAVLETHNCDSRPGRGSQGRGR